MTEINCCAGYSETFYLRMTFMGALAAIAVAFIWAAASATPGNSCAEARGVELLQTQAAKDAEQDAEIQLLGKTVAAMAPLVKELAQCALDRAECALDQISRSDGAVAPRIRF